MQKLLGTLTMILISAVAGFSQLRDDNADNGPIVQVGYGVITPVSSTTGGTSGMVVFETFGFRRTAETTQAGVVPGDLTTNAVLFVTSSNRLSRNLGVSMANPNSTSVNVTMTLRRDDGTLLATATTALPARNQTSKFVTELFAAQAAAIPAEFMGTMTLTSTGPIAAMGLRFRGSNFSTLPFTSLSAPSAVPTIATGIGGPGAILLPQFAAGGGWAAQIVIGNTRTTSMTVRVDLFKQDGTELRTGLNGRTASSWENIVIPPGGVVSLSPRNTLGDDDF